MNLGDYCTARSLLFGLLVPCFGVLLTSAHHRDNLKWEARPDPGLRHQCEHFPWTIHVFARALLKSKGDTSLFIATDKRIFACS